MKRKILVALAGLGILLFLQACATAPHTGVQYLAPSVVPVKTSVARATEKVSSAQVHARTATTEVAQAQTHAKAATTSLTQLQALVATNTTLNPLAVAAKREVDQLTQNLTSAQTEVGSLQVDLADAQTAHATAQTQADSLQTQVGTQTDQLNTAVVTANKAIAERDAAKSAYHKIKFYVCFLAAGLVGFLVWKFKFIFAALGPYALIPMLGLPAAAFAMLWMFL